MAWTRWGAAAPAASRGQGVGAEARRLERTEEAAPVAWRRSTGRRRLVSSVADAVPLPVAAPSVKLRERLTLSHE